MDLNLEERFTAEELNEIRKRVFSFADQMFLEGVSVGRELNREEIYDTTEKFVKDKLSAMTSYFVRDDLWKSMPPHGYNSNPAVNIIDPTDDTVIDGYENSIKTAINRNPENMMNNVEDDIHPAGTQPEEKPEWAKELENKNPPPEHK